MTIKQDSYTNANESSEEAQKAVFNLFWSYYLVPLSMQKMLQFCVEGIKQVSSGSANHNYFFGEFCKLSM